MTSRTDFIARTSRGVVIRTFETRAQAIAWAETEGSDFPGFMVAKRTEQVLVTELVLRRDRSHLHLVQPQAERATA